MDRPLAGDTPCTNEDGQVEVDRDIIIGRHLRGYVIERHLIGSLDTPEDMDPFDADHCPVEPVVPGAHRDHRTGVLCPFHLGDHIPHRGVLHNDPAEYFHPVKGTCRCVHCNEAVEPEGFCFERQPPHRCVPARVRKDSGVGDLHESYFG